MSWQAQVALRLLERKKRENPCVKLQPWNHTEPHPAAEAENQTVRGNSTSTGSPQFLVWCSQQVAVWDPARPNPPSRGYRSFSLAETAMWTKSVYTAFLGENHFLWWKCIHILCGQLCESYGESEMSEYIVVTILLSTLLDYSLCTGIHVVLWLLWILFICSECLKIYRKSVLHLLRSNANLT